MSNDYKKFCLVIKNLLIMLENRGYKVNKFQETLKDETNENNVKELYNCTNFEFTLFPQDELKKRIKKTKIMFTIHEKPTVKLVTSCFSDYKITEFEDTFDHELIIVLNISPSNTIRSQNKHIQYFSYQDLYVDKISHALVPKHELITDPDEITDIVQTHKVYTKWQFPYINHNDPIARYYGAKNGDLFKITRINKSSGYYFAYKCVQ